MRWFFGTGEVNFGSLQDELWDIRMCFYGTGEVDIWVITRWIIGHFDVTFWDRRSLYWDITRWIMGQNKVTFGANGRCNIFYKMKNDLTTGTWQDNIWCPIIIILLCTSDGVCYLIYSEDEIGVDKCKCVLCIHHCLYKHIDCRFYIVLSS